MKPAILSVILLVNTIYASPTPQLPWQTTNNPIFSLFGNAIQPFGNAIQASYQGIQNGIQELQNYSPPNFNIEQWPFFQRPYNNGWFYNFPWFGNQNIGQLATTNQDTPTVIVITRPKPSNVNVIPSPDSTNSNTSATVSSSTTNTTNSSSTQVATGII